MHAVRAALFDFASGSGEPAVTELGFTDARRGIRGHLALASRDDSAFTVMHRAEPGDCVDKPGRCTRFEFHEVRNGSASSRPLPLLVPEACPGGVAGLGAHEAASGTTRSARWRGTPREHGVHDPGAADVRGRRACARGLQQRGFVGLSDGKEYLFGRCTDGLRRAFRPARVERKSASFDVSEPMLGCLSSGLEVHFSLDGPRHYRFEKPEQHVEAHAAQERFAPAGARAVWTGEACSSRS